MTQADYYNQAPVGYLTVDASGAIQAANQPFCRWVGLTGQQITGRLLLSCIDPQDRSEFSQFWHELKRRQQGQITARLSAAHSALLWVSFDFSVRADAAGTVLFHGVASDVSRQAGLEDALKERRKELRCLYRLSDLLANPDISLEEALMQATQIIPAAFRFPERTRALLEIDGTRYSCSKELLSGPMLRQEILVSGSLVGNIEVLVDWDGENPDAPAFLPEEEELIQAVAAQISRKVERAKALEEKSESDRLLSLAQVVARVGYYSMDLQTGCWTGSPVLESIFGIDGRFERTVESWQRQIAPEDRAWLIERLQKVIREGLRWDVEYRWVRPSDGQVRWLSAKGEFDYDTEGKPIRLSGFIQDISERKQAEQELRIREAMLSQTQAIAHVGSWRLDMASGKLAWSDEVYRIFGLQPQQFEATYTAFLEFVHPEDRDELDRRYQESLLNPQEYYEMEHRIIRRHTGEVRYVLERAEHQRNAEGEIVASIGMVQDITEYKKMLVVLQQAKEAAEESNRLKGSFVANVSHEIRTPMNAILGFTEMMLREADLPERHRQYLQTIAKSGEHLLELINDVLEISKIESGRLSLQESDFSLQQLLGDMRAMFLPKAEGKGLKLIIAKEPETADAVIADRQKLSQILINLIDNAIKFTEQGEVSVLFRCCPGEAGHGDIRLRVEVRDNGPGICEKEQAGLFQLFSQTRLGAARGGTGLGLAISRNYARMMGGDVSLRSRPGTGSVFVLEIPARTGRSEYRDAPVNARIQGVGPGQKKYRILVVDDEAMNREVMAGILAQAGFDFRPAVDGEAALRLIVDWQPDLILMDIRMPGFDGYEATRRLREMAQGKDVPVIGVSASIFEQDRQQAIDAGMNDFISKPFKAQELLQRIGDSLNIRYLYETEAATCTDTAGEPSALSGSGLNCAEIARIPEKLLQTLREGAANADYFELMAAIERLQGDCPTLAGQLRNLVLRYNYEACLELLNHCQEAENR